MHEQQNLANEKLADWCQSPMKWTERERKPLNCIHFEMCIKWTIEIGYKPIFFIPFFHRTRTNVSITLTSIQWRGVVTMSCSSYDNGFTFYWNYMWPNNNIFIQRLIIIIAIVTFNAIIKENIEFKFQLKLNIFRWKANELIIIELMFVFSFWFEMKRWIDLVNDYYVETLENHNWNENEQSNQIITIFHQ